MHYFPTLSVVSPKRPFEGGSITHSLAAVTIEPCSYNPLGEYHGPTVPSPEMAKIFEQGSTYYKADKNKLLSANDAEEFHKYLRDASDVLQAQKSVFPSAPATIVLALSLSAYASDESDKSIEAGAKVIEALNGPYPFEMFRALLDAFANKKLSSIGTLNLVNDLDFSNQEMIAMITHLDDDELIDVVNLAMTGHESPKQKNKEFGKRVLMILKNHFLLRTLKAIYKPPVDAELSFQKRKSVAALTQIIFDRPGSDGSRAMQRNAERLAKIAKLPLSPIFPENLYEKSALNAFVKISKAAEEEGPFYEPNVRVLNGANAMLNQIKVLWQKLGVSGTEPKSILYQTLSLEFFLTMFTQEFMETGNKRDIPQQTYDKLFGLPPLAQKLNAVLHVMNPEHYNDAEIVSLEREVAQLEEDVKNNRKSPNKRKLRRKKSDLTRMRHAKGQALTKQKAFDVIDHTSDVLRASVLFDLNPENFQNHLENSPVWWWLINDVDQQKLRNILSNPAQIDGFDLGGVHFYSTDDFCKAWIALRNISMPIYLDYLALELQIRMVF